MWEVYAKTWKTQRPARDEQFAASLAPHATYTDPNISTTDLDGLQTYMDQFQASFPGGHFVTTWFQAHHQRSVAGWNMVAGDGTVVSEGVSMGTWDADGRLTSMTGFYEPPGA